MTAIAAISFLLIGLLAGFYLGRKTAPTENAIQLKDELAQKQEELTEFKSDVSTHFSRTSELMESMATQYQQLQKHLTTEARRFAPSEPEQSDAVTTEENASGAEPEKAESTEIAKLEDTEVKLPEVNKAPVSANESVR